LGCLPGERRPPADRPAKARPDLVRPEAFNIGINVGEAAGQTVFHLHVHLIPRYRGDVPDPRGGVRHVIPGKGRYPTQTHGAGRVEDARWTKPPEVIPSAPSGSSREESAIEPPAVSNRLVSGGIVVNTCEAAGALPNLE
jgi:hypothetical protein